MNLINGKYLKHEICAFSGNDKSMWLVVYDGKYNYYLFNCVLKPIISRHSLKYMPYNGTGREKQTEYYSNYDNAVNNLVKVVANDGFLTRSRRIWWIAKNKTKMLVCSRRNFLFLQIPNLLQLWIRVDRNQNIPLPSV